MNIITYYICCQYSICKIVQKSYKKREPRKALKSFEIFFTLVVDCKEVSIGVFCEQSVEVLIKFFMEFSVAVGAKQAGTLNAGIKSMPYHENVVELEYVNGHLATANITSGVSVIQNSFCFFATSSKVLLVIFSLIFQHPSLFLHLHAPRKRQ